MRLPPRVSGFEMATLEVKALSASDISKYSDRNVHVILETEADSFTLSSHNDDHLEPNQSSLSLNDPLSPSTSWSIRTNDLTELEWEITRPIRLAVEYRHSCSLLVSFVTKSSVLKKKRVIGLASVRLDDCPDGEETNRTVPVFATAEVKEAMLASATYHALRDGGEPARLAMQAQDVKLMGFVSLSFVLHPGVSRAHRKICKRDMRFRHVYEAWEAAKEVNRDTQHGSVGDIIRSSRFNSPNEDDESSDGSESEEESDRDQMGRLKHHAAPVPGQAMIDDQNEEDEKGLMPDPQAHKSALHKRVRLSFIHPFSSAFGLVQHEGLAVDAEFCNRTRASSSSKLHAPANSSRTSSRPSC